MPEQKRPTRGKVVPAASRLAAKAKADRSARRRRLGTRILIGLGALVPVLLLAWVLLASPLLAVRHVAVSGTHRLTAAQVRAAADVVGGTPLARVDAGAVVRHVRSLRTVEDVHVSRRWPSTLHVTVTERTPVAGIVTAGGVTLVDADGVPFAPAAALPPGV